MLEYFKENYLFEGIEDKDKKVFEKILDNSGYKKIAEEFLENVDKHENLSEEELNEAPTMAPDLPVDAKIMLPVINSAFQGSVMKNFVNVQPISIPRQYVFSPIIKDNLDKIIIGNEKADWTPPGDYTDKGEGQNWTGELLVAFENIFVNKSASNFFNRKIRVDLTQEMIQDIKNVFGIDYYNENLKAAGNALAMIQDYDILKTIEDLDYTNTSYNYKWDGSANQNAPQYATYDLITLIEKACYDIARDTRKGLGNFIICSPAMASVFTRTRIFKDITQIGDSFVFVIGKIHGITIIVNTLMDDDNYDIYVGKHVPYDNNGGIILAPYKQEMTDEAIHPDTFVISRGIMNRYGICVPDNGNLFYRKITVMFDAQDDKNFPFYNYNPAS